MARKDQTTSSGDSESAQRDYVGIAICYAQAAVADKKGRRFGRLVRLAAARFLDDLKRAKRKNCGFVFDSWHACDACGFIECLPHVEGRWDTPNIVLAHAHIFFVVQLFGFRKSKPMYVEGWGDDNMFYPRRFTSALFAIARKNAKSTMAAAILLYCECCEPEEGAQVMSAATTFSQAAIVFKIAKRMVEKTSDLADAFGLELFSKSIARAETGSSFKPIHARASSQDGLNPSHVGLDEIHAHKTSDLLNVLTSAAGARSNPLWLYTTTEGYINAGPWGELRQFAKQLLEGMFGHDADHFLVVFYAIDDGDAEFDPAVWVKANPLIESNPHLLEAIKKEAVEAKAMPSKAAEFRIKRLNRQSSSGEAWINLERWNACQGAIDLDMLSKHPCTAALDLSSTTDLTSWRLVWRIDGVWYTWGRRWCPKSSVMVRTERGTVPYAGWVEAGYMQQTDGDVIDYGVIEEAVMADFERFKPAKIAYDRWNASDIINRLVKRLPNETLVEFVQGPKSYHPAMHELERAYISGNLVYGDDPVLTWCASNVIARRDANLNMAPDKRESPDKIDDLCALLMGIGLGIAMNDEDTYTMMFV